MVIHLLAFAVRVLPPFSAEQTVVEEPLVVCQVMLMELQFLSVFNNLQQFF